MSGAGLGPTPVMTGAPPLRLPPLCSRDDQVVGVCVTVTDSTEQRTARERLTLLNEASVRIGRTLDVMCTGQELADPVGPRLADLVCVDLVDELLSGEEPQPGSAPGAVLRRVANRSRSAGGSTPVDHVVNAQRQRPWADRSVRTAGRHDACRCTPAAQPLAPSRA